MLATLPIGARTGGTGSGIPCGSQWKAPPSILVTKASGAPRANVVRVALDRHASAKYPLGRGIMGHEESLDPDTIAAPVGSPAPTRPASTLSVPLALAALLGSIGPDSATADASLPVVNPRASDRGEALPAPLVLTPPDSRGDLP